MESVIRNVDNIDAQDRQALERVLGQPLEQHQQLVIRVVTPQRVANQSPKNAAHANGNPTLPDWCNVYAGLSDDEIADLEKTILTRADLVSGG